MAQVGQAPRSSEPAENNSWMENRVKFVERLTSLGFQSIQDYDEVRKLALSSVVRCQLVCILTLSTGLQRSYCRAIACLALRGISSLLENL